MARVTEGTRASRLHLGRHLGCIPAFYLAGVLCPLSEVLAEVHQHGKHKEIAKEAHAPLNWDFIRALTYMVERVCVC